MKFSINPITQSLCLILGLNSYVIADETTDVETVIIGEQNYYLNPNVSSATKTNIDPLNSSRTVNIINQQFIQDVRAKSLEDTYGYTTGLTRSAVRADGFTLRGMAADLNTLQVNGLPGLASRFGSPTTANVEQVEILKGPASILYGQIQPGGLVNIITKKPEAIDSLSLDFSTQTYATDVSKPGDDNGYTLAVDATGALDENKNWLYRFIAGGEKTDSYRQHSDTENFYLFPSLTYRNDESTEVTFGLEVQEENRAADDGLAALNNDINQVASIDTNYQSDGDSDDDKGVVAFATFNTLFNNGFDFTADWRSVWHEDERHLYELRSVDSVAETAELRDRDQLNKREYHTLDARTTGSLWTGKVEHQILLGANIGLETRDFLRETYASYTVDFYNPTDLSDRDESAYTENHRITEYTNYGIYAQDTINLTNQWSVMGGLRYVRQDVDFERVDTGDTDAQSSDAFVSQGGIVYKATDSTSVYASYGESFNPNSIENLDEDDEIFDPEEGRQYEVGVKTNLLNDKTNLTIAYFDIKKTNIIEEDPNTGYDELIGEVNSTGVEVELLMLPVDNWQVKLGYAYVDSRVSGNPDDNIEGNRSALNALHDAYFWTKYNLPFKVSGGILGTTLGVNYESERYTSSDETDRLKLPAYATVDIGLHYELDQYRASLNIENLFDELYYEGRNDTELYAGDLRNITLSLSAKF